MGDLFCVAEVTWAKTEYVDMVNVVVRRHIDIKYTVQFIQEFAHCICSFKENRLLHFKGTRPPRC